MPTYCNGTGKKIDKKPPGADQNGMIQKEETVEISIPACRRWNGLR